MNTKRKRLLSIILAFIMIFTTGFTAQASTTTLKDVTSFFAGKTMIIKSVQNGKYMCADIGYSSNVPLMCNKDNASTWETFVGTLTSDKWLGLKALTNNKYVSAMHSEANSPLRATVDHLQSWECFRVYLKGTDFYIKSQLNNKWLCVRVDKNQAPVEAYASDPSTWERFDIYVKENGQFVSAAKLLGATSGGNEQSVKSANINNGQYVIKTAVNTSFAIDVQGNSFNDGTNIHIFTASQGNQAQTFTIELVGNGFYRIVHTASGKVLDVAGGVTGHVNLQLYTWNGTNAQLFRFIDAGNGYYYIQNALGYYVDLSNGVAIAGQNVWVYTGNQTVAQKWKLEAYTSNNNVSNNNKEFDPIWPCANTYTVTTLYKYSDATAHSCRFKYGIDIGAPQGENVLAVESGTVIRSEYSTTSGFGNWIMIQHDNGKVSLYAHLSSRKVSVGQTVTKGQEIGKVGNTSAKYNIGPHLHFELGDKNVSGASGDAYQQYYKEKYAGKIVLTQAAKKYSNP